LTYDGQWTIANNPSPWSLYDLDMISASDGWATTFFFFLHYDGVDWEPVWGPVSELYSIEMLSPDNGWATGQQDGESRILHWDGDQWGTVSNPSPETAYLAEVKMLTPNLGWIVGQADRWAHGEMVVMKWNGEIWSVMEEDFPDKYFANAILPFTEDDIWVVGSKLVPDEGFCDVGIGGYFNYPLAIHWDGESWTEIPPTNDPVYCGVSIDAASGAAPDDIWTSLTFHWDGRQWSDPFTYYDDRFSSMQMLSPNDGWTTYGSGLGQIFDGWGEIRHWDGTSWIPTDIPTKQGIAKIDMISPNEGWAVGSGGAMLQFRGEAPVGEYIYLPLVGKPLSGN
jgi:hypothetical protein